MAGRKVENASYLATDWQDETESKNLLKKGWDNLEFTNMLNNSKPSITATSSVDIDGVIYIFDSEELILDTPSDGLSYIIITGGGTASVSMTNTALPNYDYDKKGYYSVGGERYVLQFEKSGSDYFNQIHVSDLVKTKVGVPRTANYMANIDRSFSVINILDDPNYPIGYTYCKYHNISQAINSIASDGLYMISQKVPTAPEMAWDVSKLGYQKQITTITTSGLPIGSSFGNPMYYNVPSILKDNSGDIFMTAAVYSDPDTTTGVYKLDGSSWSSVIVDTADTNGFPRYHNKLGYDKQTGEFIWTKSFTSGSTSSFQFYTSADGVTWSPKGEDAAGTWATSPVVCDFFKIGNIWHFGGGNVLKVPDITDVTSITTIDVLDKGISSAKFDNTGFTVGRDASDNLALGWSTDGISWTTVTGFPNTSVDSLHKTGDFYCLRIREVPGNIPFIKELWFDNIEDLKTLSNYELVIVRATPYARNLINIDAIEKFFGSDLHFKHVFDVLDKKLYDWGWNKPRFIEE